jgi:hypothetical protein
MMYRYHRDDVMPVETVLGSVSVDCTVLMSNEEDFCVLGIPWFVGSPDFAVPVFPPARVL